MAWNPDPAWIALIGTVAGTIGLKVAEHYLGKGRVKIDDAAKIRDELRIEIAANKQEIKELEDEVDKWRMEYLDLREKYFQLQTELTIALQRIKDEQVLAELRETQRLALDKLPPAVIDSREKKSE